MTEWKHTHTVVIEHHHTGLIETIHLYADRDNSEDGFTPLYTEQEWDACVAPGWGFDGDELVFQGSKFYPYKSVRVTRAERGLS